MQEFFETEIKNMTVLNERIGITGAPNNVNLDETDALVEVLVESLNK